MKRYTILLLLLLILPACLDRQINLNQVITPEIDTENLQNTEVSLHAEKLWLITDALKEKESLHGQIISVVGYVGLQRNLWSSWNVQFWNDPLPHYEDIWRYMRAKEPNSKKEKWNTCWGDECWKEGRDYSQISYACIDLQFRPEELPEDIDPRFLFGGWVQDKPDIQLKSLDKYVLKVLVKASGRGSGFTLVDIVEHIEMPKEQPPESINEDNPMSVTAFKEQYEDFYDQTVCVIGWVSPFSTDTWGIDSFGFCDPNDIENSVRVLYPYNQRAYFHKMAHQGLRAGNPYIIRIHVHSPETHTVRLITGGTKIAEAYPFVILWVDKKIESQ